MPVIDGRRIVRGRVDAPITLIEYTDFQCPYCGFGAKTVEEVLARYEGQVRLVVKHAPLQFHPMARPAAQYFEALSLQSAARAWAYYDRLFANLSALGGGEPYLRRLAGDLGADMQQLDQDLAGPVVRERLADDLREVQRYQFDGVPAFIVNGHVIEGAQPVEVFVDVVEAELRR
jgi:protein-disulfide isomerase